MSQSQSVPDQQHSGHNKLGAPIFVVGYMHSGTTLVQSIVGGHPDLFTTRGESRFFHALSMLKRRYPDLEDEVTRRQFIEFSAKIITSGFEQVEHSDIQTLSHFGMEEADIAQIIQATESFKTHDLFCKAIFDYFTIKAGKGRWLEKTPTHLFHIDKILSVIPDAQFIEIVRDPRDILGSKSARVDAKDKMGARNKVTAKVQSFRVGYDPVWDSLAWRSAINSTETAVNKYPGRIMRVRYEDLVNNPDAFSQEIFDFLGLDYSDERLNVAWKNTSDDSKWKKSGISSTAVGKWKTRLTPSDVVICQYLTRNEMATLAYQPEPVSLSAKLRAPFAIFKSGYEFFERIYRRYKLGGLSNVRTVLENYVLRIKNVASSSANR